MGLVLDASAAMAWLVNRMDAAEARLADAILRNIQASEAVVPALWFSEIANGVLVAERRGGIGAATTAAFMGLVNTLPIAEDRMRLSAVEGAILTLARKYDLTGYDATYLELVLRSGGTLATFDRQLAEAARKAGGRVFGDAA
jgi:predicted nucleic acid-binding protein